VYQNKTQYSDIINLKTPWFRASNGLIFGVCAGLGRKLNTDPWLVRIGLLASILIFGAGAVLYLALAIGLPKESKLANAHQPRLLGVCARISEAINVDVGLIRTGALLIGLGSMGTTLLAYLILHFLVDKRPTYQGR
jgi:phage shock protein PspC (stress-responsive transcriptional regulator)